MALPPSFRPLAPVAHCEGVATGPDGVLWTGDELGAVFRVDPADGAHEQVADIGTWVLGLAADARSRLYVCAYADGSIVRVDPATGERDVYCDGLRTPNWCVFAPDGTLYVSESGPEEYDARAGRIVRIPSGGGSFEPLDLPPLAFANGMALSAGRNAVRRRELRASGARGARRRGARALRAAGHGPGRAGARCRRRHHRDELPAEPRAPRPAGRRASRRSSSTTGRGRSS